MKLNTFVCPHRSGSTITDMNLNFTYNQSLPSNDRIIETIWTAPTGFNMTNVFGKYEAQFLMVQMR